MKIACLCLIVQLHWLLGAVFVFPINRQMQPAKTKQYGIFAKENSVFSDRFWSLEFTIPAEAFLSTPVIT